MKENTRKTILVSVGIVLVLLLGVWWYTGFSLDFMKFFAASPDVTSPTPTAVVPTPIVGGPISCSPSSQATVAGQAVTITASGGTGVYAWFAPQGNPPTGTGTAFSVAYPSAGTKKVTLQGTQDDGSVNTIACTVVVQ